MKNPLNIIKSWFVTGATPTEEQFHNTFDSFHHKDNGVLITEKTENNGNVNIKFSDETEIDIKSDYSYGFRFREDIDYTIQRVAPKVGLNLYNTNSIPRGIGAICLEYNARLISTSHIHLIEVDRIGSVVQGMAHNEYILDMQGAVPAELALLGSKILMKGYRPRNVNVYYEPLESWNGIIRIYIGELTDVHQSPSYIFLEKVYAYVRSPNTLTASDFNIYLENTAYKGNLVTNYITKITQTYA